MDARNKARLRNSPSFKKGEPFPPLEGGGAPQLLPGSPLKAESAEQHDSSAPLQPEKVGEGKPQTEDPQKGFGNKTISFWGSCALNFNNITGPAMVVLPLLFQQAGWLLPAVGLLAMWAFSSFAATMLCEAMQKVPGNRGFGRRLEYCTLVRHYFGPKWYLAAMVGFNAGLIASNIAAMIVTAQVLDSVAARALGTTYGLTYGAWPPGLRAQGGAEEPCPWGRTAGGDGCSSSVITLGYFLAAGACIPMSFLSLEANMWLQWLSVSGQLAFSLRFLALYARDSWPGSPTFCPGNGPQRTPLVGGDASQVMGISVFSYSYVSTIPSWANERQPGVSINQAVWLPSLLAVSLNISLAFLGAWAYQLLDRRGRPMEGSENILNVLVGRAAKGTSCLPGPPPLSVEASAYAWGLTGYLPGIPVLAIMVRYNLQSGGLMGPRGALLVGVLLPWLLTAFCYQAEVLVQFCNWVAILCQGFINFVVPPLLFRAALLTYPDSADPSVPCPSEPLTKASGADLELVRARTRTRGAERVSRSMSTRHDGSSESSERRMEEEQTLIESRVLEDPEGSDQPSGPSPTWIQATLQKSGKDKVTRRSPIKAREFEDVSLQHERKLEQRSFSSGREPSQPFSVPPGVSARHIEGRVLNRGTGQCQRSLSSEQVNDEREVEHNKLDVLEEEKGDGPVNAVPMWIGVSPVEFATWMAIGLGLMVCASIIASAVQAMLSLVYL